MKKLKDFKEKDLEMAKRPDSGENDNDWNEVFFILKLNNQFYLL